MSSLVSSLVSSLFLESFFGTDSIGLALLDTIVFFVIVNLGFALGISLLVETTLSIDFDSLGAGVGVSVGLGFRINLPRILLDYVLGFSSISILMLSSSFDTFETLNS